MIIPFFRLLGYDPNDPDEVVPEADASFSDKFKNRVDYAIYKEGVPVIAVETKKVGSLSVANRGELKGYYNAVLSLSSSTFFSSLCQSAFVGEWCSFSSNGSRGLPSITYAAINAMS